MALDFQPPNIRNQGWTKLSNFNDLDALAEAEWDKVQCPHAFHP